MGKIKGQMKFNGVVREVEVSFDKARTLLIVNFPPQTDLTNWYHGVSLETGYHVNDGTVDRAKLEETIKKVITSDLKCTVRWLDAGRVRAKTGKLHKEIGDVLYLKQDDINSFYMHKEQLVELVIHD